MALIEHTLWGVEDKAQTAIDRIRLHAASALRLSPRGFWVAFSGGKDSVVLLDLVRRAGVLHYAAMNLTTVDPPELLWFVRDHYPGVDMLRADVSMWALIKKNRMPPTSRIRFCCAELKERHGEGIVLTGVRWAESPRRGKRQMVEACYRRQGVRYLHPIIDWSTDEVWQYIRERGLPHCSLYDEGFRRIGCIGCPMGTPAQRIRSLERWPKIRRAYIRTFDQIAPLMRGDWQDGEAIMRWWIHGKNGMDDENMPLFE